MARGAVRRRRGSGRAAAQKRHRGSPSRVDIYYEMCLSCASVGRNVVCDTWRSAVDGRRYAGAGNGGAVALMASYGPMAEISRGEGEAGKMLESAKSGLASKLCKSAAQCRMA